MSKDKFFNQTSLTAAGFLGIVFGGMHILPKISPSILAGVVTCYGSGVALSTAFFRVQGLLKNGTKQENELFDGTLAGIGVLMSMTAIYSGIYIKDLMTRNVGDGLFVGILALGSAVAGFIQFYKGLNQGESNQITHQ